MNQRHTVRAFDEELKALANGIATMGDFAAEQFRDASQALLTQDSTLAQRIIQRDTDLDALAKESLAATALVVTRRQPVAADFSEILLDFRIIEDLERVGDLAKNTAKRATAIANLDFPLDIAKQLQQLSLAAAQQLRDALAAYVQSDSERALSVRFQDEQLDLLHTQVFRELVARMPNEPTTVVGIVHLLFCAKNIERVGDHATHIAEAAYERATGHPPTTGRRRLDDSSFFSGEETE